MKQCIRIMSILALGCGSAFAEPVCLPTSKLATSHYPGAAAIPPTNNLTLPSGKSIESGGQKLVIRGQLFDRSCKPIPEAVVELWQANPYGSWQVAQKREIASPDPVFAGAGRAITDSSGRFSFITSFPGVTNFRTGRTMQIARAPQLNIRVSAPDIADFSTVLFFGNDRRNATDPLYKRLKPSERASITMPVTPQEDALYGDIQLVLPAYARYRTY